MTNAAAFSGSSASGPRLTAEGFLLPTVEDETVPFWEAAAEGKLEIQACRSCGRLRMPPRPMCPWCRSSEKTWVEVSGRATIWSFAVPHPPLLPAYAAVAPYNVVVAALEEDPTIRLVGNLVADAEADINSVDPASITIGEPVEVVFAHQTSTDGELVALPRWVRRTP
jgi:hypothetical protein